MKALSLLQPWATLDHNLTHTGFLVSCTNAACLYGPEPGRAFVSVEDAVSAWQGQAQAA